MKPAIKFVCWCFVNAAAVIADLLTPQLPVVWPQAIFWSTLTLGSMLVLELTGQADG